MAVWPALEHREYSYVILLNRAAYVLGVYQLSSGGTTGTVVDPKLVFQSALKANASAIILAHNHPSGNLNPSEEDKKLTKKIQSAGSFLDINLYDHLILTNDGYKSFADEGLMS
jgi:DNA repair protein RadC